MFSFDSSVGIISIVNPYNPGSTLPHTFLTHVKKNPGSATILFYYVGVFVGYMLKRLYVTHFWPMLKRILDPPIYSSILRECLWVICLRDGSEDGLLNSWEVSNMIKLQPLCCFLLWFFFCNRLCDFARV